MRCPGAMTLSTTKAKEVYRLTFYQPVQKLLSEEIQDASRTYSVIGNHWAGTRLALDKLDGQDAHVPSDSSNLVEDLKDMVTQSLHEFWQQHSPKQPGSDGKRALGLRLSAIERACDL